MAEVDHAGSSRVRRYLYGRNLTKPTIARKIAALRTFFKFCVREGYASHNPAKLLPLPNGRSGCLACRPPKKCRIFSTGFPAANLRIPVQETHKSRSICGHSIRAPQIPVRNRAMLEFLYACGMRVSELAGLNLGDIDRKSQMLRVLGKGRKQRVIPFGDQAALALDAYVPGSPGAPRTAEAEKA